MRRDYKKGNVVYFTVSENFKQDEFRLGVVVETKDGGRKLVISYVKGSKGRKGLIERSHRDCFKIVGEGDVNIYSDDAYQKAINEQESEFFEQQNGKKIQDEGKIVPEKGIVSHVATSWEKK